MCPSIYIIEEGELLEKMEYVLTLWPYPKLGVPNPQTTAHYPAMACLKPEVVGEHAYICASGSG